MMPIELLSLVSTVITVAKKPAELGRANLAITSKGVLEVRWRIRKYLNCGCTYADYLPKVIASGLPLAASIWTESHCSRPRGQLPASLPTVSKL